MAWKGEIMRVNRRDSGFRLSVEYYDDAALPSERYPKEIDLPTGTTQPVARQHVIAEGQEIRNQVAGMPNIVGTIVDIP